MTYANGRLPDSALATIPGTTQRMRADLVPQVAAMRAAFQRDLGFALGVTDGYRSYDAQVRVKAQKGNLAATPGTSNHGWGQALDLGSGVNSFGTAAHNWMRANAARFGGVHPAWAQKTGSKPEAWHWEFTLVGSVPPQSHSLAPLTASQPKPQSQSTEVEDMTPEQAKQLSEVHWMLSQVRSTDVPAIQKDTKRLGHIHAQVDLILAATTNITNGVVGLIKKIGG